MESIEQQPLIPAAAGAAELRNPRPYAHRVAFETFHLDLHDERLWRGETVVHLHPKTFAVLACLVTQASQLVTKEALLAAVWPEAVVSEAVIAVAVRQLRRVLGDQARTPRFIATVHGRGYRFIAPVQELPHEPAEDGTSMEHAALQVSQRWPTTDSEGALLPVASPTMSGRLTSLAESLSPPGLTGEYKQVTVLCGGLAEALALAGRLGPEAMHRCMQTVFALVQEVTQRYDGSLLEFSGEGFVALFGAPVAQEDHAQRAVLAALALQAQLETAALDTGRAFAEPLALCLGLHTGRIVVDCLGEEPQRLYTAASETTQMARHLRQHAAPGTIQLSAATQHLVQTHVRVEPQGEVQGSAGQAPMPVYRVQGIAQQRSGVVGRGTRASSPFVGRTRELALLQERRDAAVAGQGQVVAVVGEPGMGKSRLLAEYRHCLDERAVRYLEGHCLSYGSATPYLPLLDLVRQLCGLTADEPPDASTAKISRQLQRAHLDPDEGVPLLLALLDVPYATERLAPYSPPERKARTFALLRHLFVHEAQQQPCVLTVENLHWCDATSAAWLTYLVERLAGTALLVLVTYRPGYQPSWLGQSYASQLALARLREGDSRTLAQAVLQTASVPETVVSEIVTQAAGNPFFVEELAWNVRERGGQPAALAVPETIEAVLAARIDRLLPAAKHLLQRAAVIGMTVPVPMLQAMTDLAPAELHTQLEALQAAEFFSEIGSFPVSTYTFKHALIHEVAYGSLLQEHRRMLHERAAQALEVHFAARLSEHYYALAHHYSRSGNTSRAVEALQRVGQQAVEHSAYAEAMSHLMTALDLLATQPETPARLKQELALHMPLGIALRAIKGQTAPEVTRLYTRARLLCEQVGEPEQLFRVLWGLWHAYGQQSAYETRRELGAQLLHLAEGLSDPDLLLEAHHALWTTLLSGDEPAAAWPHLEQGRRLYDLQRHRAHAALYSGHDPGVCCCMQTALCLWFLGYPTQAVDSMQAALTLAQDLAHPLSHTMALRWAAVLYHLRREAALTQTYAEASIHLATEQGFPSQVALVLPLRGWALAARGEEEEGLSQITQGLAAHRATGATQDRVEHLALLAATAVRAGRITVGLAALTSALTILATSGVPWWESELYRLKGEILLQQPTPRHDGAAACFQQALTIARRQQAKSYELRAAMSLARLWQQQGQRGEAYALLAPLYGWFTEGFDTADLQEAKALLEALA